MVLNIETKGRRSDGCEVDQGRDRRGRLKTFIDRRLIKAVSHPLREHVLAVLNERVASTAKSGREIDLEVPAFYHHVEVLEELGFLERVESRRRRGAKEHFFRAKTTMFFNDRADQGD